MFRSDFFIETLRGDVISSRFLLRFFTELLVLVFLRELIEGSLRIYFSGVFGYASSLS